MWLRRRKNTEKKVSFDEETKKILHEKKELERERQELLERAEKAEREKEAAESKAEKAESKAEKAEAKAEKLEKKLYIPLHSLIQGAPFTTVKFTPAWGDPLRDSESAHSTATKSSWLEIGKDNVGKYTDEQLVTFLKTADDVMVDFNGASIKLLDIILKHGNVSQDMSGFYNGTAAGYDALQTDTRVKGEDVVEAKLLSYLWNPLCQIMGGRVENVLHEHFPVIPYIRTVVRCGSERGTETIAPMPRHYQSIYIKDKCIEMTWLENVNATRLPDLEHESEPAHRNYASLCSRIVVEVKPDVLCPIKRLFSGADMEERNNVYSAGLYEYMTSPYFDERKNPVAQAATYAAASRTNCFMIHTLNHMTLACFDGMKGNLPYVLLSKKFDCTSLIPPFQSCGETWSFWEILIRFILASRSVWYMHQFPDALKEIFKEKTRNRGTKRDLEGNTVTEPQQEQVFETDSEEVIQAALSQTNAKFAMQAFSYADLWAPHRFAVPATHSIEEECSLEYYEGDAVILGEGRMGTVYRKRMQGYDAVVKVLVFSTKRIVDHLYGYPVHLREELANEYRVYSHLVSLQGKTIPMLLWYGELIESLADALVTAYCGESLEERELSHDQKQQAWIALKSLHEHGVLHGDVEVRNFACGLDSSRVFILDFGFSKFRQDVSEEEWNATVAEEEKSLRQQLNLESPVQTRKRRLETSI
jgi:tRNA A-37 threonylcarbamoyl transferase component Bud32